MPIYFIMFEAANYLCNKRYQKRARWSQSRCIW